MTPDEPTLHVNKDVDRMAVGLPPISALLTSMSSGAATSAISATDVFDACRQVQARLERTPLPFDCVVITPAVAAVLRKHLMEFSPHQGETHFDRIYGLDIYYGLDLAECRWIAMQLRAEGKRPRIFAE